MEKIYKAEKHDEVLNQMEAEIVAQSSDIEETPVEQEVETTPVEESAPAEQTVAEEDEPEVEEPASEPTEEDLTEEEETSLSEKTRRQMSRLRDKARRAEELELENENLKKQSVSREPLEKLKQVYEEEPAEGLPWESALTVAEATKIARAEVDKERKLARISEDADFLESTYLELDPTSEDYDPELAQDIYNGFQLSFLSDDSVRLRDLAERKLNLLRKTAERVRKEIESETKIAKQSAEQALPATVSSAKPSNSIENQIRGAKSIAELEALENKLR